MSINRILFTLPLAIALCCPAAVTASDLADLAGKWSVNKVNDQGQEYLQTIEVKKDKFVFQILGTDHHVILEVASAVVGSMPIFQREGVDSGPKL